MERIISSRVRYIYQARFRVGLLPIALSLSHALLKAAAKLCLAAAVCYKIVVQIAILSGNLPHLRSALRKAPIAVKY